MRSVYELLVLLAFAALIIAWVVFSHNFKHKMLKRPKWFREEKATFRFWMVHFGSLLSVIVILCSAAFMPTESLFFQYDTFDEALQATIGSADYTLQGDTISLAIKTEYNFVYKYSYVKSSSGKWYLSDKVYRRHTETELFDYRIYTFSARGSDETIVLVVEPGKTCASPNICDQYESNFEDSDFTWITSGRQAQSPFESKVAYAIIKTSETYYNVSINGYEATIKIK